MRGHLALLYLGGFGFMVYMLYRFVRAVERVADALESLVEVRQREVGAGENSTSRRWSL